MKKYLLIIYCCFLSTAGAQPISYPVQFTHYVFDSFRVGTVKVKSGKVSSQKLNYNILSNEMIFDDGGTMMAIAHPEEVDTVFILGRKFIPIGDKFYELLTHTATPLLVEFTYKLDDPGAPVGYGNASPVTNANAIRTLIRTGGSNALKLPDDFKVIPGFFFWIMKDGSLQKAGSVKQLSQIFPGKKEMIRQYVKAHHIDFTNPSGMKALLEHIAL